MSKKSRARKYRRTRKERNPRRLEVDEEVWWTYLATGYEKRTVSVRISGYVIDIYGGKVSQYRIRSRGYAWIAHRSNLVSIFGGKRRGC